MAFDWATFLGNSTLPYDPNVIRDAASGLPTPITNIQYDPRSGLPIQPQIQRPIPVAGSAPPLPNAPVVRPGFGTPYPGRGRNLYDTPFVRDYVSPLLPEGEYQMRLNRLGMGDMSTRFGQFGQSQFGNTQRKYQVAQLKNPALSFRDFLHRGGAGDLKSMWRGMSSGQRGLNAPSRTSIVRLG
jgi:hypothetical protein